MIRPLTLLCALLAAGAGAYLFAVKHHAQVLDDQLAAVTQASREDGQRIRVLQAQWALEIDPNRLNQLAARFTNLQPMQPAQLVTLSALARALPAPGSPAPGGSNPDGTLLALPGADPYATVIAANGLPLPPPPMPAEDGLGVALASAAPAAAAPAATIEAPVTMPPVTVPRVALAAAAPAVAVATPLHATRVASIATPTARAARVATAHRTLHQAPVRLAQNGPAPVYAAPLDDNDRPATPASAIYGAYRPYTPPPPPPPRPYGVQPMGAQLMSVKASAAPADNPPAGSMLGMAANALPAPQPFDGSAN